MADYREHQLGGTGVYPSVVLVILSLGVWLGSVTLAQAQQCLQAQLSAEFSTDPTSRTYASCAATDDQCVLDKFNAPCADPACKVDVVVSREHLYEVIDKNELATLLAVSLNDTTNVGTRQRSLFLALNVASFDLAKASVRQKLLDIFPAPSAPITNAAIVALQQKNASRAEVVCSRKATLCDVSLGRRGDAC
jgi:hypothetical protein